MRIEEWLRVLDRDRERGWYMLATVSADVAARLSRRRGWTAADADDSVADVVIDLIRTDGRAVRRAHHPEAPLASWVTGAASIMRRRRARPDRPGATEFDVDPTLSRRHGRADGAPDAAPVAAGGGGLRRIELHLLTDAQRRVLEQTIDGASERSIATSEGVGRSAVRGRKRRAVGRLAKGARPIAEDRTWAVRLAATLRASGGLVGRDADIVAAYARGDSHAQIAVAERSTPAAIRQLIYRWRKRNCPSAVP